MAQQPKSDKPEPEKTDPHSKDFLSMQKQFAEERAALTKDREQLEELRAKLEARLEAFEEEKKATESEHQRMQAQVEELKRVSGTTMPFRSGHPVQVNRGDFLVYKPSHTVPQSKVLGGWFKVDGDPNELAKKLNRDMNQIAVSNKDFQYDSACGAPYHSVNQKAFWIYTKSEGPKQVGDGMPAPIVDVASSLEVPAFAR